MALFDSTSNANGDCCGEVPSICENFHWLNLNIRSRSGVRITCAQGALNASHLETVVDNLVNVCPVCNQGGAEKHERRSWTQQIRVLEYPEVLTLALNRWNSE